ncbi:MAG: caspase family protein, partial [bacterium]|nr:caspase family protein [bacterium]
MRLWFFIIIYLVSCAPFLWADKKNEVCRFVLLAGANNGGPDRKVLRYAVSDARSIDRVLREMGGVPENNRILLVEPTKEKLMAGLQALRTRAETVKDDYGRVEFIFYYSGHSDEEGILLASERYTYRELREVIKQIPADMHIMILDSCSSGALTRVKGGTKQPPFLLHSSMNIKGYAIMTSSSADEVSQESDNIGGSFFTHYIVSGLRGAADSTCDGRITLNEVYQFAYQETLSGTEKTVSGPQHPNYDIQMTGTGDVVLTDIRENSSGLILTRNMFGRYFIRDKDNQLVAEVNKKQGYPLDIGLSAGTYQVSLLKNDNYFTGRVNLVKGSFIQLDETGLRQEKKELTLARGNRPVDRDSTPAGEEYVTKKWVVAIIPELSLPAYDPAMKLITRNHVYLVYGKCTRLKGFGFSFGGDVVEEEMRGFQCGLCVNYVRGQVRGAQFTYGLNYVKGTIRGAQIGTVNICSGSAQEAVKGEKKKPKGSQVGIVNISRSLNGADVGVVNIAGFLAGPMVGVVNIAKGTRGPLVGTVNISRRTKGVMVGVVN